MQRATPTTTCLLRHRHRLLHRFASTTTTTTTTTTAEAAEERSPPPSQQPFTAAFANAPRQDLRVYHRLVRTAQVAEALRRGYQEGAVAGCMTTSHGGRGGGGEEELHALLRATRTRPSLLTPVAGAVGVALRWLPLPPGTGTVGEGVLSSISEAMDANVRTLIELEKGAGEGGERVEVVKAYMKEKRDGVAAGEQAQQGEGGGGRGLTQATQLVCRTLLNAAARL